jgi:hypothetical protein
MASQLKSRLSKKRDWHPTETNDHREGRNTGRD